MRKTSILLLLVISLALSCTKDNVDYSAAITDGIFKQWCLTKFDLNDDGILSEQEVIKITDIDCSSLGITALDGIEQFTNLLNLFCYGNPIKNLDLSGNTKLESLYCQNCEIESINLSGLSRLRMLNAGGNQLTEINLQDLTNLRLLHISDNQLRVLDLSKNKLIAEVECMNNCFSDLDLSGCEGLVYLRCRNNPLLRSLNVSGCSKLLELSCNVCVIKSLNIEGCKSITQLYCNENAIKELDLSEMKNLITLWAYSNKLENLDLSGCSRLQHCHAYQNKLTSLNLDGCNSIEYMNISDNLLTQINFSSCANTLKELYCQNNKLAQLGLTNSRSISLIYAFNNEIAGHYIIDYAPRLKVCHLYNNPFLTGVIINGADQMSQMNANNCSLNEVSLRYAARSMELFWCENNPDLKSITLQQGQTIYDFKSDPGVGFIYM